jgi:hypothetical protein
MKQMLQKLGSVVAFFWLLCDLCAQVESVNWTKEKLIRIGFEEIGKGEEKVLVLKKVRLGHLERILGFKGQQITATEDRGAIKRGVVRFKGGRFNIVLVADRAGRSPLWDDPESLCSSVAAEWESADGPVLAMTQMGVELRGDLLKKGFVQGSGSKYFEVEKRGTVREFERLFGISVKEMKRVPNTIPISDARSADIRGGRIILSVKRVSPNAGDLLDNPDTECLALVFPEAK